MQHVTATCYNLPLHHGQMTHAAEANTEKEMTVLTQATEQWSNRPADQRFNSLEALHAAVCHHKSVAVEATDVKLSTLRIAASAEDPTLGFKPQPHLISPTGAVAKFTHHSFGQLCRRIGAPASYLRQLPASVVADNMNYGLSTVEPRDNGEGDNLLFSQNGSLVLRAALSPSYTRIWNCDVTSRLIRLTESNPDWQPAPEAFDGSRGLYASDKDMFAFLVDNDRRIFESLPGGGLGRGFFVSNSEVGDASFRVTTFLYEFICGNHRVWGATGVQEIRIPHIGDADARAFSKLTVELKKYSDSSAIETEQKIQSMRVMELGATKDEVLDAVFNLGTTRKVAALAYEIAEKSEDRYGNPRSVWGFTGGLTEVARDLPNADERVALERQAGKIMQIAF